MHICSWACNCRCRCTEIALNHPNLNLALRAAREGAAILRNFVHTGRKLQLRHKGPTDYVTQVDLAVEEKIFGLLRETCANHSLLGEENGLQRGKGKQADYCWILDPLDGTANFLHGFPHFCVSLALELHGQPECAVIIDPIRGEEFTAVRGKGAFCNERRIRCSSRRGLTDALVANSSHDSGEGAAGPAHDNLGTIRQMYSNSLTMRRTGSAALDMAYVAAGRLDCFWGSGLKHWDLAAGRLLVIEAGGMIADYVSDEVNPCETGRILCSAAGCFGDLSRAVRDHLSD